MNSTKSYCGTSAPNALSRVPLTVFLFLGVSRQDAHGMGMLGCGLQLDDSGEYSWADATASLDLSNSKVCIFLRTKKIDFPVFPGKSGIARISLSCMREYIALYATIVQFLDAYHKNRFLRLGRRAFLDPWDLDSHDSHVLLMDDESFSSSFIVDPRGQPLLAEITTREGRHSPKQFRAVPGMPVPGRGSWI